jgi:hypothetical protein
MSIVYKNNAGTKTKEAIYDTTCLIGGPRSSSTSTEQEVGRLSLAGKSMTGRKRGRSLLISPDNNPAKPSEARQTSYDLVFDAAGRLSSEKVDSWENAIDRTETFTLDLFRNRTRHQPCG